MIYVQIKKTNIINVQMLKYSMIEKNMKIMIKKTKFI